MTTIHMLTSPSPLPLHPLHQEKEKKLDEPQILKMTERIAELLIPLIRDRIQFLSQSADIKELVASTSPSQELTNLSRQNSEVHSTNFPTTASPVSSVSEASPPSSQGPICLYKAVKSLVLH